MVAIYSETSKMKWLFALLCFALLNGVFVHLIYWFSCIATGLTHSMKLSEISIFDATNSKNFAQWTRVARCVFERQFERFRIYFLGCRMRTTFNSNSAFN